MTEKSHELTAGAAFPQAKAQQSEKAASLPMAAGVALLWLLFWPGFIVWWALMSALFRERAYVACMIVAYALPALYTLAAYIASRRRGRAIKLLHSATFLVLSLVFAGALAVMGEALPLDDAAPYLSMAFIAAVMGLMQYPRAGLERYEAYRSSLFIGGVIFMPLFIYFAALLPNVPHTPALDKVYLFPIGMLGFWLSAAWLALRATQGDHVPALELQPLLPFRCQRHPSRPGDQCDRLAAGLRRAGTPARLVQDAVAGGSRDHRADDHEAGAAVAWHIVVAHRLHRTQRFRENSEENSAFSACSAVSLSFSESRLQVQLEDSAGFVAVHRRPDD